MGQFVGDLDNCDNVKFHPTPAETLYEALDDLEKAKVGWMGIYFLLGWETTGGISKYRPHLEITHRPEEGNGGKNSISSFFPRK